jgi:hypothetical protein
MNLQSNSVGTNDWLRATKDVQIFAYDLGRTQEGNETAQSRSISTTEGSILSLSIVPPSLNNLQDS